MTMLAAYIFQVLPASAWRQVEHNESVHTTTWPPGSSRTTHIKPAWATGRTVRIALTITVATQRLFRGLYNNAVAHEHSAIKVSHGIIGVTRIVKFHESKAIQNTHINNRLCGGGGVSLADTQL